MKRINRWAIVSSNEPYQAPECRTSHIIGEVYNRSRFSNGERVTTSAIIGKKGNLVCTASGSEYQLGRVSQSYSKMFKNARKRLFENLEEVSS